VANAEAQTKAEEEDNPDPYIRI